MVSKWKQDLLFVINKPPMVNNVVKFIKDGKLHNIEFPAVIAYNQFGDGNVKYQIYYFENRKHRNPAEGPAIIKYYLGVSNKIKYEFYYFNDKKHRTDGPAEIWYYPDGTVKCQLYYYEDKLHRVDGPAKIWYYPDGTVEWQVYYYEDKLHRVDGPAKIWYHQGENNGIISQSYYINGKKQYYWNKA